MAEESYAIRAASVGSGSWIDIFPPFDCNYVAITCKSASAVSLLMRSNSADATTEKDIAQGTQPAVIGTWSRTVAPFRFRTQKSPFALKGNAGTADYILEWIR